MTPPTPQRRPTIREIHGERLDDPYAWLADADDPAVRAHLEAENAYAEASLAPLAPLREQLLAELRERIGDEGEAAPLERDGWSYYSRWEHDLAYPLHCRRFEEGEEQLVLDENALAGEEGYLALEGLAVSPDHGRLAFAVDRSGDERCDLHLRRLPGGEEEAGPIPDVGAALAWGDGVLYFTRLDESNRPAELCRLHSDGRVESVLHEPDPAFRLVPVRSESGAFVIVTAAGPDAAEVWLLDADDPEARPRSVLPRRPGVEYSLTHQGERLYLVTNDGAENFKVLHAPAWAPPEDPLRWRELLPHRRDTLIHYLEPFANHLVVHGRRGGHQRIWVWDTRTDARHEVELPESACALEGGVGQAYRGESLRFYYSSPLTPDTLVSYQLARRRLEGVPRPLAGYRVERLDVAAADGAKVPLTLVYREALRRPEGNPLLLYGYGAYGLSVDPAYSAARLGLLDRGVIYAIAHVRGGGERGRPWHRAGRGRNKGVGIDDFLRCAEHLVESGWAEPGRLAAMGESAGALLVGAALNRRPELFRAAVLNVPFLDPVTSLSDPEQPLTPAEWAEWGDPSDAGDYRAIRDWAPYDNLNGGAYPDVLVTASLNDPRTPYWEAAKWVARLRERAASGNVLLRIAMEGGHGGLSGQFGELEQQADRHAFLLDRLGVSFPEEP